MFNTGLYNLFWFIYFLNIYYILRELEDNFVNDVILSVQIPKCKYYALEIEVDLNVLFP